MPESSDSPDFVLKASLLAPFLSEAVKKFPKSPPPCPSPVKGEEIYY
jgi:hypothetical protein